MATVTFIEPPFCVLQIFTIAYDTLLSEKSSTSEQNENRQGGLMSKLFTILLIFSLSGCGGKNSSDFSGPQKETEAEALGKENIVVGQKYSEKIDGDFYEFSFDQMARSYVVTKKAIQQTTDHIVINSQDQDFYTYSRTDKEVKVLHQRFNSEQVQEALHSPDAQVSGDTLWIVSQGSASASGEAKSFTRSFNRQFKVDLNNSFCHWSIKEMDTENLFTSSGLTRKLPLLQKSHEFNCGEILNPDELRSLDLSDVQFCDLDGKCLLHQDLNYLIKT